MKLLFGPASYWDPYASTTLEGLGAAGVGKYSLLLTNRKWLNFWLVYSFIFTNGVISPNSPNSNNIWHNIHGSAKHAKKVRQRGGAGQIPTTTMHEGNALFDIVRAFCFRRPHAGQKSKDCEP